MSYQDMRTLNGKILNIYSAQSLSRVQLFATPWTAACQASLSITNSQSLLRFMSIESVMPSNHLILCCPLLLLSSIFPSIRVFPVSQVFTSDVQSIGVLSLASVLLMNTQDWSPLEWTSWTSLQSKGLSRVFSSTTVWKCQFLSPQLSLWTKTHMHTWLLEKPELWLYRPLSAKWCLCFLTCSLSLSQLFFQGTSVF